MRYLVTWNEVSNHERELSADDLATCLGLDTVDPEMTDYSEGLADGLAQLDNDGFVGLTREDIRVIPIPDDQGATAEKVNL